jgi:2,4-dienoyl-CoA reductase (NADPH2)
MTSYPRLFEPYSLGHTRLANRIVMLPHGTGMLRDGAITQDDIAYYEARARSGPGLMITGAAVVHPSSAMKLRTLVEVYSDHVLEGLQKRADMVRSHGVVMVGQIVHLGRELIGGESEFAPMAPSPIRSPRDPFPPHTLDEDEIRMLVEAFGHSAYNLKRTGHDGVEIHGGHGYLVGQFLSPATNHRDDAYGGTPENRIRFLREVIESIRTRCGDAFLLGLRLSADEEIPDGLSIPDTARIAKTVSDYGSVDYLSITLGTRGMYVKDATAPEATSARAAKIIRDASGMPIIVGQRITRPEIAERILAEGQADLIGMARAFIADADWVGKAARGEAERIRPCVGLNQDCRAFSPHLHCAVNPTAGRELRIEFKNTGPASQVRRIAVVGAGPAGLEAARVAASRGHQVTLFEATDGIGGQFLYAASLPHRSDLRRLIDHIGLELRRHSVRIEFRARIDGAQDLGGNFDMAVVATGAVAKPLPEQFLSPRVMRWFDILEQGAPVPTASGRAVLVDDGSAFWWTYGVGEMLVEAGWRLLIATPSAIVAGAIPTESVGPLLARLGRGGTEYRVLTVLDEVAQDGASLMNVASGNVEAVTCDLIVLQTGRAAVSGLANSLRRSGMEAHAIGDCVTPRRMSHAVFEAQRLALSL